ncbi:MAG TPA: RNA polymerase sigma factor [Gemmatimonadaceae bacterium]|nr:RNA polymerase sigma factor [Gemmatimonadaceae bacterium]
MGPLDDRPDASIVAAVLTGNAHAYGILVTRYRDTYTRFAARMLGSLEDADDALQLAFVRAYRNLDQCRDPDRFGSWLYQIVVNECRTFGARRARRERHMVRDDTKMENASTDHPSADAALRDEIQYALDRLEPGQREAFLLRYIEGLRYEEMAEITGVGISALKMRVKRATERLRGLLAGVVT